MEHLYPTNNTFKLLLECILREVHLSILDICDRYSAAGYAAGDIDRAMYAALCASCGKNFAALMLFEDDLREMPRDVEQQGRVAYVNGAYAVLEYHKEDCDGCAACIALTSLLAENP